MKKTFSIFISFALPILFVVSVSAQAKKTPLDSASAAKIVQLLKDSGHIHGQLADNVWLVRFRGNTLDDVVVTTIVSPEGLLILSSVVAEKKDFRATPELMAKLLRMNNDYDRMKVGIKENGDMFVRIDLSLRVTDSQEFKLNVEQVSAAADEIAAAIKPFLLVAPAAKKPVK
ncbi:MAG: YbjN domain-containing protein [Acidobacteria bacterium]|nr:YbjN domain-containing protein [Acidobacteriota bacterium]